MNPYNPSVAQNGKCKKKKKNKNTKVHLHGTKETELQVLQKSKKNYKRNYDSYLEFGFTCVDEFQRA
jgi:hypothetical protein